MPHPTQASGLRQRSRFGWAPLCGTTSSRYTPSLRRCLPYASVLTHRSSPSGDDDAEGFYAYVGREWFSATRRCTIGSKCPQTSDDSHSDHLNGAFDQELGNSSDPPVCGHSTSPDSFWSTQRDPHSGASPTTPSLPVEKLHLDIARANRSSVVHASVNSITVPCISVSRLGGSTVSVQLKHSHSASLLVPTIMVSNSTAALALPLESSSNLHSHQDVPLAIRRGKKPPPVLTLDQAEEPNMLESADSNSYPDIPSAFLGASPTSPSFNRVKAGEPSKFDMGLSTMCSSLKALVPPPPFTPTEAEHQPPLHPPPSLEPETRWATVAAAQLPDADDEEWRFAQDLIVEWQEGKGRSGPACTPASSPPHMDAYTGIGLPIMDASGKGSPASTSAGPRTDQNKPKVDIQQPAVQSPPSVKQSRRKTVIIQAPDGDIQISPGNADRPAKSGKLCSPSGDRSIDFLLDEFDEPVPFEIPSSVPLSAPASFEGSFFTPPNSRPTSTATASSAGLPIRGILKEKKSVRFSAVPSLYEYAARIHDEASADHPGAPSTPKHHSQSDLDVLSALRRVPVPVAAPTVTRTPSKSSPLRKMQTHNTHFHSHGSHGPEEASPASPVHVPSASATMPTTSAPTPQTLRSAPPTCRAWSSANTANSPSARATTMAKHPTVRALAHKPSPSHPPRLQIQSPMVGAGAGGAVVGAPALQSPYPTMSSPSKNNGQRRTPLKTVNASANARQNAGTVERTPSPVKQSHHPSPRVGRKEPASLLGHEGKENVGRCTSQPVSVRSSSLTPTRRRRSAGVLPETPLKGENPRGGTTPACAGGGAEGSQRNSGGSRMPVPLRSIFTKLRT